MRCTKWPVKMTAFFFILSEGEIACVCSLHICRKHGRSGMFAQNLNSFSLKFKSIIHRGDKKENTIGHCVQINPCLKQRSRTDFNK